LYFVFERDIVESNLFNMADHARDRSNSTHSERSNKTHDSSKSKKKKGGGKKGSSISGEIANMFGGLTRGSTFANLCGRSSQYHKPNLRRA
jgi:hypothetical protein